MVKGFIPPGRYCVGEDLFEEILQSLEVISLFFQAGSVWGQWHVQFVLVGEQFSVNDDDTFEFCVPGECVWHQNYLLVDVDQVAKVWFIT